MIIWNTQRKGQVLGSKIAIHSDQRAMNTRLFQVLSIVDKTWKVLKQSYTLHIPIDLTQRITREFDQTWTSFISLSDISRILSSSCFE